MLGRGMPGLLIFDYRVVCCRNLPPSFQCPRCAHVVRNQGVLKQFNSPSNKNRYQEMTRKEIMQKKWCKKACSGDNRLVLPSVFPES